MARPRPMSPRCPRCNAPITLVSGQVLYTCGYCDASIDTQGEKAPLPHYEPAVTGSNQNVAFLVAGIGVALFVAGAAVFLSFGPDEGPIPGPLPTPGPVPSPVVVAPPPAVVAQKSKFQWDSSGLPMVVDLNGDGTDDIVGRIRRLVPNTGGMDIRTKAAAFDGKSLELLWEVDLEGQPSELHSTVLFAHQGGRVVMSTPDAVLLLEPATGKPLGKVALSDKPKRLCVPEGDTESVWVEVSDERHLLLNTATTAARPATQPPPSCVVRKWNMREDCYITVARKSPVPCVSARHLPAVPGFRAENVYKWRGLEVVTGERNPGSRMPMAAVFEPGAKAPLWVDGVGDMDPKNVKESVVDAVSFSDDALFMVYGLKQGGEQLVRRDLRTGRVIWDVPVPNSASGSGTSEFKQHGGRVYVPHWVWLDVFDAKTGNLVGTLGAW